MCNKGYVLIITLIILLSFLLLGMFMLDHYLIQHKINQNIYAEVKTYYLALAGVEHAEYRLRKNHGWRTTGLILPQGADGEIKLVVYEENGAIRVDSSGVFQSFSCLKTAYFTKTAPLTRIQ